MIIIHAYLKVDPERREEFLEVTKPILAGSQAEEGNLYYQMYEEVGKPNSFVIVEGWKDQQAVEAHNQMSHFLEFGKVSQERALLAEPPRVEVYTAEQK